jgi:molecular chaperone DnaJ
MVDQAGADRHIELTLPFREAVFGVERELEVERLERCGRCHGQRVEPGTRDQLCLACRGEGRVRTSRTVAIMIPAGVEDGAQLRLPREGDASLSGGLAGNLYVHLRVQPDPIFQRDGDDLLLELPITASQAISGAEVEVPTLEGSQTVRIPAGIQSGWVVRVRGHGVPHLRGGGRGDLVVTAHVIS